MNGKGDKNRTSDYRKYWESPFWDKKKEKEEESIKHCDKIEEHESPKPI